MCDRHPVEFVGQAAVDLPETLQTALREDLTAVFKEEAPRAITVSRCYAGYSGVLPDKVVLGVELRLPTGFATHIVKVGSPYHVAQDYEGWQQCVLGRDVASRILLPVRKIDGLPGGRVAILYRDAYTLFGPDRSRSSPEWLETVVQWSVLHGRPDPVSVERALVHIYTDLARWLYYGSSPQAQPTLDFYTRRLGSSLHNWFEATADASQRDQARRRWELRRDAIWLFCGGDPPESKTPAAFLDPCDFLAWALASHAVPASLVGRGHGDLHGRNVLLGAQRGEAELPVIFDYGAMGVHNVLVWDFVKLETEIKNRLLPELFKDDLAREALLKRNGRLAAAHRPEAGEDTVDDRARRATRLQAIFRFEQLLAERTAWIQGKADAEARHPPGGRAMTGNLTVDRLLALLLRIRQEAALWLGYERGRQHHWQDEYYFGLAAYGLVHAQPDWDYEPRQAECAFVSAGVAAARLQAAQAAIRDQLESDQTENAHFPSYRVPLALAHRRWRAGRIAEGMAILDQVLPSGARAGSASSNFLHAVPLLAEQALLLAEEGQHTLAEAKLRPLQEGCKLFGDHETLSRMGRAFKESGDAKWGADPVPFENLGQRPARQMYRLALKAYQDAFDFSSHYYPGINAACLAVLTADLALARENARKVLGICAAMSTGLVGEEAVWVFATEGEASLIVGDPAAATFYGSALDDLAPTNVQVAQSMYDQLCRLWLALGKEAVEPVIRVFESRPAVWKSLRPGPLGDCGGRLGTGGAPSQA